MTAEQTRVPLRQRLRWLRWVLFVFVAVCHTCFIHEVCHKELYFDGTLPLRWLGFAGAAAGVSGAWWLFIFHGMEPLGQVANVLLRLWPWYRQRPACYLGILLLLCSALFVAGVGLMVLVGSPNAR